MKQGRVYIICMLNQHAKLYVGVSSHQGAPQLPTRSMHYLLFQLISQLIYGRIELAQVRRKLQQLIKCALASSDSVRKDSEDG